jgi:ribosomal-protein-alanine N-acetyltransferase
VNIPELPPTLESAGLRLRGLRPDDAPAWSAYLTDFTVIEHTSYPVQSLATVEALIEQCRRGYAERRSCEWALTTRHDDALIGTCGFNQWAPAHASAELAYALAPQHWGTGLMTQAVDITLQWGFETVGFNRIYAVVMVSNGRSARLLERAGFLREGTLRSARIARGVPRDFWMYSLLRSEWTTTGEPR